MVSGGRERPNGTGTRRRRGENSTAHRLQSGASLSHRVMDVKCHEAKIQGNPRMASLYRKPITKSDSKSGNRVKTKSKKWWGRFRDENGVERRVPLATDKTSAQAMLHELVKKTDRRKAGLEDVTDDERKRPLKEHLAEFKKYLTNKGVSEKQIYEGTTQIQKIIDRQKWAMISDINASGALDFLGTLRRDGRSAQTYNHYLRAVKQFTRWLVRERRTVIDPLSHLSRVNTRTDRRHDRRSLSSDEFQRLVKAAELGPPIETIPGCDRAMMYFLAAWTGFRKGEIGSLTRRSFDFDGQPPTATVAAAYSKRKRQDSQILHPELVRRLKEWLESKVGLANGELLFPVSGRVPGGTERKTNKMMRRDLQAARDVWLNEAATDEERAAREQSDLLKYETDDGLFADFHANRHMFITNLERAGISPKMAQTLARHSDVRLTLGVYTHVGLHDQTAAIESLPVPSALSIGTEKEAVALRKTGTDSTETRLPTKKTTDQEVPTMVPSGAEYGAILPAQEPLRIAPDCIEDRGGAEEKGGPQIAATPERVGPSSATTHHPASVYTNPERVESEAPPAGLEPATFGLGNRCSILLS